jgi:hypothetical protein
MRPPRCLSLRSLLALLSLLLTLPMLVLSVTVGAMQVQAERRQIEAEAIGDARDLLQRADRLVANKAARLRRLARDLDSDATPQALATFHAATGMHLFLLDAEGTPRAETRPTPLPPPVQEAARALRAKEPGSKAVAAAVAATLARADGRAAAGDDASALRELEAAAAVLGEVETLRAGLEAYRAGRFDDAVRALSAARTSQVGPRAAELVPPPAPGSPTAGSVGRVLCPALIVKVSTAAGVRTFSRGAHFRATR